MQNHALDSIVFFKKIRVHEDETLHTFKQYFTSPNN